MQIWVFLSVTALIAFLTWLLCRNKNQTRNSGSSKDYFLAGGNLSWVFVAGSITLTNVSTDMLVGMNGAQMALLALWELSAVVGLIILAKVFLPIYYRYNCTTTTELLERRYGSGSIRSMVAAMFLGINIFIYMPMVLYTGSLFMQSLFAPDVPILWIALGLASLGTAYAVLGGLRAVAVSDTISGVAVFALSLLVLYLALEAIDFDFSGIPAERLTLIGDNDSPIPWHTLLTGMLFIQIFYWSTNQTITQRAMASENVQEAQKGVFAAAAIRLCIVPFIAVVPGICAYKLYGDSGDATFGRLVGDILPPWMSGMLAAVIAAAVLTTFNSVLNSSAALYVCDLHEKYLKRRWSLMRLNLVVSLAFMLLAVALVPLYAKSDSIVNTVQQLNGLFAMPILSAFITGLCFSNVDARAVIAAVVFGLLLYAVFTFWWTPLHYIHLMFITLWCCVGMALLVNRTVFGRRAKFGFLSEVSNPAAKKVAS
ncbi:MAG: SLC5 family protein [Porticoccaceae bacterium]|nr:SLC5 family protein [Porticoccaceae bacterium]